MTRLPIPYRQCTGAAVAAALALWLAAPAHAALNNPVTLQLIAPGGTVADATPISELDLVDPSVGIAAGDGSTIGGSWMLPGEFISFVGNTIRLHVAAGADNGGAGPLTTGFLGFGGSPARYDFSLLAIAGQTIVGVDVKSFDGFGDSGFSGVVSGTGVTLTSPSSVRFNLDDLVFVNRGGGSSNSYGEFRIDLLTAPVPEPATWALLAGGLLLLPTAVRLRRRNEAFRPCAAEGVAG